MFGWYGIFLSDCGERKSEQKGERVVQGNVPRVP